MKKDIKKEISELLKSKFGDEIEDSLKDYYQESNPKEIINLARHMLSGLIGEYMAEEVIAKITRKKDYQNQLSKKEDKKIYGLAM